MENQHPTELLVIVSLVIGAVGTIFTGLYALINEISKRRNDTAVALKISKLESDLAVQTLKETNCQEKVTTLQAQINSQDVTISHQRNQISELYTLVIQLLKLIPDDVKLNIKTPICDPDQVLLPEVSLIKRNNSPT